MSSPKPWSDEKASMQHVQKLIDLHLLDDLETCVENAGDSDLAQAATSLLLASETKTYRCQTLIDAIAKSNEPFIHGDSLTALLNDAVHNFALSIADITSLKKGQKIKVLLLNRNLGDALEGTRAGKRLNLKREIEKGSFMTAEYTHDDGLTGVLDMLDGAVHDPFQFQWQINQQKIGGYFWGPIGYDLERYEVDPSADTKNLWKAYDRRTKVGWRGPAILLSDVDKLPSSFVHYDTWWDDYVPWLEQDMTEWGVSKK